MGTTYIAYPGTGTAISGGFIVAKRSGAIFDGEWQTDLLPVVGLVPPSGVFDGEWQTDSLPIVAVSTAT